MTRIDRYIVGRVLLNFVLLFAVLYLFAATIDIILNLDEFTELAVRKIGEDSSWFWRLIVALGFAANYHLPQVFRVSRINNEPIGIKLLELWAD